MQRTMACLSFFFSSHGAQARGHNTHTHKHTQSAGRWSAVLNQVCGAEQTNRGRGEELSKQAKRKKKMGAYSAKKQEISIETIRDTAKAGRGGQAQDRGLFWTRRPS